MSWKRWVGILFAVGAISAAIVFAPRSATQGDDSVTFGAIMALTGDLASYGTRVRDGIQLAVEEINASGGMQGRHVRIVFEDNQGDPDEAVTAFQKLIDVDHVPLILGPMLSTESLATAPIAESRHVVQLSTLPGTIALSSAGDYVFRVFPSDGFQGLYLARAAYQEFGARRAAIAYLNNAYGTGIRRVVMEEFQRLGGEIVADEAIADDASDFSVQLTKIRQAAPDIIFGLTYFNPGAQFLAQAVQLGVDVPVLGGDAWSGPVEDVAGDGAKLLRFSSVAFGEQFAKGGRMRAFLDAFQRRYERTPTSYEATGYDAVYTVKRAVELGGFTAEEIKDALHHVDIQGALGRVFFNENGDNAGAEFSLFTMVGEEMVPFSPETPGSERP